MNMLYAMITRRCNLSCPHCNISKQPERWHHSKFMDTLNSVNAQYINMFGGEPTYYKLRFLDVFYDNQKNGRSKIKGVSTNLTILDDDIIAVYKQLEGVSTSWNADRFGTDEVFNKWLNNCQWISEESIKYTLLITLTEDLFSTYDPKTFSDYLQTISKSGLKTVKFEHYIGHTADKVYFNKADVWLAEVVRNWNLDKNITLANIGRSHRYWMDCRETYTLFPDGALENVCPNGDIRPHAEVCEDCLECEYASKCMPCKLCRHCSYMFKTRDAIQELEARWNEH